jgi:hypothetical protein
MSETAGAPRVVVGYDALLAHPRDEMLRVARALALPAEPVDSAAFARFAGLFLDPKLRHHGDGSVEVALAPIISLDALLRDLARDEVALDSAEAAARLGAITAQLPSLDLMLECTERLDRTQAELRSARDELEALRRSRSWRFTAPLRWGKRAYGRVSSTVQSWRQAQPGAGSHRE